MTASRVIIFLIVLAMAAAIVTAVVFAAQAHQTRSPSAEGISQSDEFLDSLSAGFGAMTDRIRTTFGYPTANSNGLVSSSGVVGRAVGGVNPPSVADRIAALLTTDAGRHRVTSGQEVIMTGVVPQTTEASPEINSHSCLGADSEVLLEIRNDIGADQLDVSYAFEDFLTSSNPTSATPIIAARVIKVASCGKESMIRQCIPVAPTGRGVRLHTLAYYYEPSSIVEASVATDIDGMITVPEKKIPSSLREEKRMYSTLLDTSSLKKNLTVALQASAFIIS